MPDWLKQIDEWLTGWLDDLANRNKAAPSVIDARDRVRWARNALSNRPADANHVPTCEIEEDAAAAFRDVQRAFPDFKFDVTSAIAVTSIASSTSGSVSHYLDTVNQLGSPDAHLYAVQQRELYRLLQQPARVRDVVARLAPNAVSRFGAAERAASFLPLSSVEPSAAANELRNLLLGVKGEVFERARNWPSENMTWERVPERLQARGPLDEWASEQLRRQIAVHKRLNDDLSSVMKHRHSDTAMDSLWSQVLDHVEALLLAVESLQRVTTTDSDSAQI